MDIEAAALVYYMSTINYYMRVCNWKKITKPKIKRRWWMIQMHRRRTSKTSEEFFSDLLAENSLQFYNFVRMSATDFEVLLGKVGPIICKQDTKFRKAIPAKVRLSVALRYLASGDSFRSLHFLFKISHQVISKIVREVCSALILTLNDHIKIPDNEREWLEKERQFRDIFPHCVGSIDGKHVVLVAPIHSGSDYHNYKHSFSIVLMAAVDRNFCFMFCDIGAKGRISDGGVLRDTTLYQKFSTNTLSLPQPSPIPGSNVQLPYVFVADNAFPLHVNLMKPYPGEHGEGSIKRTFNRKLSSARIVVENAFGVMSARFRVLRKPLPLQPKIAADVVMACALLHNFLRTSKLSRNVYTPAGYLDAIENGGNLVTPGTWRQDVDVDATALRPLRIAARRSPKTAMQIRDDFAEYFANAH